MTANLVQISHDGFARQSIMRETVRTAEGCASCGMRRQNKKGRSLYRLFRYCVQPDDSGRTNPIQGLFCSIGCMRTYHDLPKGGA